MIIEEVKNELENHIVPFWPGMKHEENEEIKQLYRDFLEKPGSHKAHELLHTHYQARDLYNR